MAEVYPSILLLIPAYNEEENIAEAVKDFKGTGVVDEVLVIDNNSKDRTAERAATAGGRVVGETTRHKINSEHENVKWLKN